MFTLILHLQYSNRGIHYEENQNLKQLLLLLLLLFIFIQDSLFSTYCTVINEGLAIEVLIIFKAAI